MKKTIFSAILTMMFLWSAQANAQTTMKEYNYVVTGYKAQLATGNPSLQGYELVDLDEITKGIRTFNLKKLVKVAPYSKKTVAYMMIYQKKGTPTKADPKVVSATTMEYICIPHPSSDNEVRDLYYNGLYDGKSESSEKLRVMFYVLSRNLAW